MADYRAMDDPDYYMKRSRKLLRQDYPIEVMRLDFTSENQLMIRWHWHEEVELQYIEAGEFIITCEEESFTASTGDIVFINQNSKHFVTPSAPDGCTLISCILNPVFLLGFGQLDLEKKYISPVLHDGSLPYLHIAQDDKDYKRYASYLNEVIALDAAKEDGYELLVKSTLLRLWYGIYRIVMRNLGSVTHRSSLQDEHRTKQAILYIQEHYMEAVTLEDIADSIMVSKSECCRCFKRTLGVTPFEYLMKYRIMESTKRMHRRPQESISELAGSVGFNNTSYYNKIFKKFMDCTPTEFKKNIAKEFPKFT